MELELQMKKIISHSFVTDKWPQEWLFIYGRKLSLQDDGLLIDGIFSIPFPNKAWWKFRVEIEFEPIGNKVLLECGEDSRTIRIFYGKKVHKITGNGVAYLLAESNISIPITKGIHSAVFEFNHGQICGSIDGIDIIETNDPDPKPVFGQINISLLHETLIKQLNIFVSDPLNISGLPVRKDRDFFLETAVDFYDDLFYAPYDRYMFDKLFREFKSWGTKKVQWIDHGSKKFGWWKHVPSKISDTYAKTDAAVGDVMHAAVEAAHAHDIELYGVFKPFDVGIQNSFGEGTADAQKYGKVMRVGGPVDWIMDFAAEHPEYLMARKAGNYGYAANNVINRIDLVKEDDSPPDITINDIEIWVSNDNATYRLYSIPIKKFEKIENYPILKHTSSGGRPTGEEKRCMVFRFENLKIDEKYIVLTSRKLSCSFGNTLVNLIHIFGDKGEERLFTYGAVPRMASTISQGNTMFQEVGIEFDKYPGLPTNWSYPDGMCRRFVFDDAYGILAIAKDKDRGELAALSPSFQAVRNFWLEIVTEMLKADVDGIDLRFSNHQCTFAWDEFGFEEPVVEEFKKRYGVDLLSTDDFDQSALRRLRGEAYTQFYRECRKLVNSYNKKMGLHIEPWMDVKPEFGGAMGLYLDWQTWIKEGLADCITMKDIRPNSHFAHEILSYTIPRNIPVVYSKWNSNWLGDNNVQFINNSIIEAEKGGYDGFQFYECNAVIKGKSDGSITMEQPALRKVFQDVFLKKS